MWAILAEIFMVSTTNYFDDFVALASVGEANSVDHTVKSVLRLLGWKFGCCHSGFSWKEATVIS